ncbi:EthD family reductase [Kineococcus aurantiacus]|uniref:EthD family reductase n=1 Tax=Kineococcus aurantiacus TaxID=37633 RepID=A0A7Y9J395_9ACTN|nr:EthD family reductase [Kineococcus aurantiacus]NYD24803.1 hypothetical protein [Kineococcus aurantiacus]
MPTRITFVVDNPVDVQAFENTYENVLNTARTLPGLQRLESARVWPKEDGTPTPAHRTLDLYFGGYQDASAAVTTAPAGELFQLLVSTGTPFTALFSDVEE